MTILYQNFWHIISLVILLAASAFFSAAETSLFNLSRRQLAGFSKSKSAFARYITDLHKNPKQLLSGMLLANLIVNTLYFAFASIFVLAVEHAAGNVFAGITAVTLFALMLVIGEMLPKSIAYLNSPLLAQVLAAPCYYSLKILAPVRSILTNIIVEPALRLILGIRRHTEPITMNQFRTLIESSRQRGLISSDENQLLGEVLEFGLLKVRQAMRPRVDIIAAEAKMPNASIRQLMLKHNMSRMPVYESSIDNILGIIAMRQLLLNPDTPASKLLEPALFVPEQKTVESLMEFFRQNKTDFAVVVDEYGGIAGTITLHDLVEEIVGPLETLNGIEPVQQIGPLTYRLVGNLAIHDWATAFGIEPTENRLATIGGLVTALLGKIPRPGDVAHLRNLKFTVELVRRNRIEFIILTLEPIEIRPPSEQ